MLDLIHAHRKLLVALVGALLIQFVDSETIDWLVVALTTGGVGVIPNDRDAVERVYRRRR